LYRLSIVVVLNGVLLAFVGLVQFFSSPRNVLFWTFASDGNVFGPFICRNHFAYMMNLSLGLGFGLLLCVGQRDESKGTAWESISELLQKPTLLWVASALTLMCAGLVCSLSRGGVVAFLSAAIVCTAIKLWYARGTIRFRAAIALASFGLIAVAWLGGDFASKRLATLWERNVLEEGRSQLWKRSFTLVPKSPLLGAGLGTYGVAEPLTRTPADGSAFEPEHAHNDYLEILIEGGIAQLGICLLLIAVLIRAGLSALAKYHDTWRGRLVLGTLFSLTTMFVQSFVDFGLHVPALVVLATIIAALLLNLASHDENSVPESRLPTPGQRLAAFGAVAVLACVSLFLVESSWRAERAERYRLAASRVENADTKIAYLDAALAYTPDDPRLQVATAEAYRERFGRSQNQLRTALTAHLLCEVGLDPWPAVLVPWDKMADSIVDSDLRLAARHHLSARRACSLLPQPHLFLAAYPHVLSRGERRSNYLQRACMLDPANAKSWYIAGLCAYQDGDHAGAWRCWRSSLQCEITYLPKILETMRNSISADELRTVLPEEPSLLYAAAQQLEKMGMSDQEIDSILKHALEVLQRDDVTDANQLALQGRLQTRLQQLTEARASYRSALALDPRNTAARFELGELLVRAGQLAEARQELALVISIQPNNEKAQTLYDRVLRELAERSN
jgi:O-antigen ligase